MNAAERRFAAEQLRLSRAESQRSYLERLERLQAARQRAIEQGVRLSAEDIYEAVRRAASTSVVRRAERESRVRVGPIEMRPRRGPCRDMVAYDEAPDGGSTLSWSHTAISPGQILLVTVGGIRGGHWEVRFAGGAIAEGELGNAEDDEPDPRLEPVDIIDAIDQVLADNEHPEHVDALVNHQIERYRRGRR
jgi:hypothetical protein